MKTIREWRELKGMTREALAAQIDVSAATVYKWESGQVEPRAAKLRAMAKVFGVLMDDIEFTEIETGQGKWQRYRQGPKSTGGESA